MSWIAGVLMGLLIVVVAPVSAQEPAAPPAEPSKIPEAVADYRVLLSEADAQLLAHQFVELVMTGNYDEAFKRIRPFFPISEARFTKLAEETKKQHGLAQLQFGKPVGQVFASADTVKETVLRIRYVEKFEWDAMYWEFMFYRPQDGWLLNGLGFDDDMDVLFH